MNIFICSDDGVENGPYSWVDIFVMLNQGDLEEDAVVRIGSEVKSISEWNHWSEGTDVGPLTWDEISTMLQAGVLDLDVQAKFEGTSELRPLQDVISQSREVHLPGHSSEAVTPPDLAERIRQAFQTTMALPHARLTAAATLLLVFIGGIYFGVYGGNQKPSIEDNRTAAKVVERETPSPQAQEPPHEREAALVTDSTPAPSPVEMTDQLVAATDPVEPNPPPQLKTLASPTPSPRPSPTAEQLVLNNSESTSADHAPEDLTKNNPQAPPAAATQNPVSEAAPSPEPVSSPFPTQKKLAQVAGSPTPKPSATPLVSGALALRDFFEIQSIKFLKQCCPIGA